jgi:hypothetical protein
MCVRQRSLILYNNGNGTQMRDLTCVIPRLDSKEISTKLGYGYFNDVFVVGSQGSSVQVVVGKSTGRKRVAVYYSVSIAHSVSREPGLEWK